MFPRDGGIVVNRQALRLLVVGGTGFIGPHLVRAALDQGHAVSVFNRGVSETPLPSGVERLTGDRGGDLDALADREWDWVVDLSAYGPGWVRDLLLRLDGNVGHYLFVSSNAVYDLSDGDVSRDEDSLLREYQGEDDPYSLTAPRDLHEYGSLKVLCEEEALRQLPDRVLIVRPGWVFGPGNLNAPFVYWALRAERGGTLVAAGGRTTPVQFVDVRDMCVWIVRSIEAGLTGIYNVLGQVGDDATLGELVDASMRGSSTSGVEWIPSEFFAAQPDRKVWKNLLFWTYESEGFAVMMRMSNRRASEAGFTTRPIAETLKDTRVWYDTLPAARQAQVLGVEVSESAELERHWASYRARELELLSEWHLKSQQRTSPNQKGSA